MNQLLVFTDLDGTLLDHHSYAFAPALPMLERLKSRAVPVIPCTSKTRSELLPLRRQLGLDSPFIVENGAAVFIPESCARGADAELSREDGFRAQRLVPPREHWLPLLGELRAELDGCFRGFAELSVDDIVALTGLSPATAKAAAAREFGEAIHWCGNDAQLAHFTARVSAAGGRVHRGGRFLHVVGPSDKGVALRWLCRFWAGRDGAQIISIAAGDGQNDVAMLDVADYALVVRSPAHPPPELTRRSGVWVSAQEGPAGWCEGIGAILDSLDSRA